MKIKSFFRVICLFAASFVFILSCGSPFEVSDFGFSLADYKNVGASVAAREWKEDYDCSNFSVQFYQNCYEAGLPCRVRSGMSGGSMFEVENHAWNSVKINDEWVNWEPQFNNVYEGHHQTWTPIGIKWGTIHEEDILRMLYEYVGRHVPEYFINLYEIDDAIYSIDSPIYPILVQRASCWSDDQSPEIQDFVSELADDITQKGSAATFLVAPTYIVFFFKYNNKYYGIEDLQENDPFEGRSVDTRKRVRDLVISGADFTLLDIDYKKQQ